MNLRERFGLALVLLAITPAPAVVVWPDGMTPVTVVYFILYGIGLGQFLNPFKDEK